MKVIVEGNSSYCLISSIVQAIYFLSLYLLVVIYTTVNIYSEGSIAVTCYHFKKKLKNSVAASLGTLSEPRFLAFRRSSIKSFCLPASSYVFSYQWLKVDPEREFVSLYHQIAAFACDNCFLCAYSGRLPSPIIFLLCFLCGFLSS